MESKTKAVNLKKNETFAGGNTLKILLHEAG